MRALKDGYQQLIDIFTSTTQILGLNLVTIPLEMVNKGKLIFCKKPKIHHLDQPLVLDY